MNTLIVGGTSGLGLELAKSFSPGVIVSGRKDPEVDFAEFRKFDLSEEPLPNRIDEFVSKLPSIDMLVYNAGFYQEGRITDISNDDIEKMINVGARALVYFVKSFLNKQKGLSELVTVTSTSQWTPRKLEPIYNFSKAAAGHFSNAIAEDGRVEKVLVVGPAGMNTPFWDGTRRDDLDSMMEPEWVAEQIVNIRDGNFKYKFAKILRNPNRVEIEETR